MVAIKALNDGKCVTTERDAVKVLIACEFSGIVRDAFIRKGHEAVSCDLLPTERPGPHIQGDVLSHLGDGWDLMIAHPPCTYLTTTGNKWFKPEYAQRFPNRVKDREDAIAFFMALANAPIDRMAIENPIGIMSTRWRKPDQIIQPFNYGAPVRKATCLWLKNLPPILSFYRYPDEVVSNPNGGTDSVFHYKSGRLPPEERWKFRSRTFPGIAEAMADQWGNLPILRAIADYEGER